MRRQMMRQRLNKNDVETLMGLVEDPAENFELLFKLFLMKKEFDDVDFTLGKTKKDLEESFDQEFLFPAIKKMFGVA